MHAIIVISNDNRIPAVKEGLQPATGGRIRIAADFDRGLKEIFDKRPPLVFIQDDIGGVSGETVARHIKALLQDNCPKIVLLSRQPGKQQGKWFDEVVDLSLAEAQLVAAFQKQLEKFLPGKLPEKVEKPAAAAPAAAPAQPPAQPAPKVVTSQSSSQPQPAAPQAPAAEAPKEDGVWRLDLPPEEDAPPLERPSHGIPMQPSGGRTAVPLPDLPSEDPAEWPDLTVPFEDPAADASSISRFWEELPHETPSDTQKPAAARQEPEGPTKAAQPPAAAAPGSLSAADPGRVPKPEPPPQPQKPSAAPPAAPVSPVQAAPSSASAATKASAAPASAATPQPKQPAPPVTPAPKRAPATLRPAQELSAPERPVQAPHRPAPKIRKSFVISLTVAAVCAAAAGGGALWMKMENKPKAAVALSTPSPASAIKPAQAPKLPSFVPASGLDAAYAKQRPGWERYRDANRDFLLFTEGGKLQAVQIVARGKAQVELPFVASAVREIFASELPSAPAAVKERDGYRVETRQVKGGEVVLYRKKKTGAVRGVVLYAGTR